MTAMPATMSAAGKVPRPALEFYQLDQLPRLPQLSRFGAERLFEMQVVGSILPFRANSYVVNELIDWEAAPDDPVFRMVFPHREMLDPESYEAMAAAIRRGAPSSEIRELAAHIQTGLNPHPADQTSMNVPTMDDEPLDGLQHKYPETVLFFPSEGQTCHSYCTFCFRWPQFVQSNALRMATVARDRVADYLRGQPAVSDLLITGGDPFVMKARRLRLLLDPLGGRDLGHVQNIRFGTKALSYWPHRFVTDPDADELLDVLRWLIGLGKHVAVMAHYNHWRELEPAIATEAVARLQETGAVIRTQSPLLRGVNDDPQVWSQLWRTQVRLGMVPYYMFVVRDTGARSSFDVPLVRAWEIYAEAVQAVSGLCRTVRGPVMSTSPGKIEICGTCEAGGEKLISLRFLQSRDPSWSYRPFFAARDDEATWFGDLRPAFGAREFFFEESFRARCEAKT
jgi:KamA family protein